MPSLSLLIPDPALRGALSEQLQKAEFGDVREGADETVLTDTADQYLILDEEAADKKILKILRETHNKKRIFFLGVLKNEWDENLITETFEKPLRLGHLLARLQFYVQTASFTAGAITFGPYRFEPHNRQIVKNDNSAIRLTEKETALLSYIAQSREPVTRDELLAAIWGYDARIDTHTLETHLYQLRRKLDPEGVGINWLINEEGAYRLSHEGVAA